MVMRYVPPQQSVAGQVFDVVFLLALVFGALFLPIWLKIAVPSRVEKLPDGVTYQMTADATSGEETKTWTGLSWQALGQNPTMQGQWEKLGYTPETAAEIITQPFEYDIDYLGLILTVVVILGYYFFVISMSRKEYREVIREKFE